MTNYYFYNPLQLSNIIVSQKLGSLMVLWIRKIGWNYFVFRLHKLMGSTMGVHMTMAFSTKYSFFNYKGTFSE